LGVLARPGLPLRHNGRRLRRTSGGSSTGFLIA
jgi:hypothetical protein